MQLNPDPKLPRGEPQLVGLTRIRYSPSSLQLNRPNESPSRNYCKSNAQLRILNRYGKRQELFS
jgi:hypothetical protein